MPAKSNNKSLFPRGLCQQINKMRVFKFGGASLQDEERFTNTAKIIQTQSKEKILVVISAMGKTTNAWEDLAMAYFRGEKEKALGLFEFIKQSHLDLLHAFTGNDSPSSQALLQDIFTETEWLLHDKPVREYDYYYDQIVCCGELLSSRLLSQLLEKSGMPNQWLDARDIIRTNDHFREAVVDWTFTEEQVKSRVLPMFQSGNIIITQGFIGCTDENESTTLGREGSDYTAAIFAHLLPGESVTIWKDVASVMNADPRLFSEAQPLSQLSYSEVIEMAFYGAQVIHPKTIKPLQNKNIPLFVKCFLDPSLPGTVIGAKSQEKLPPIIVLKKNQALIQFKTKDFSFMEDKAIQSLHELFSEIRLKPNLTQNAAISLLCCFDDKAERTENLAASASEIFDVHLDKNLTLLTIRHYDEATIQRMTKGKQILLEQKTEQTIQIVYKEIN